jgi:predicted NBD/HSP70 family sugar kinase
MAVRERHYSKVWRVRIGVDLGGTKIEAIVLDDADAEKYRRRVPTPQGDYEGTLDAISGLVKDIEKTLGLKAPVGIGTPGAISPATGLLKNSNSLCLIGKPLDRDLEKRLGRPVRLANDANCFALSEAMDGSAAGARVVFGVILGTGVGGGIVVDGKILVGPNGIAGEWGHNPLPWPRDDERPGPACYCGRNACIESFLSGPAFKRNPDLPRYEERLARALASVINLLDPDVIVLGGGVSNEPTLYAAVPKLWKPWVFSDDVRTRLVKAKYGDSSGVRGAAWLF